MEVENSALRGMASSTLPWPCCLPPEEILLSAESLLKIVYATTKTPPSASPVSRNRCSSCPLRLLNSYSKDVERGPAQWLFSGGDFCKIWEHVLLTTFTIVIPFCILGSWMRKLRKNKKGLSPFSAVLILIVVAVVAGIVTYMLASGYLAAINGGGAGQQKLSLL